MSRNLDISVGEFYHVYNRGADKRVIFVDNHDNQRFVKLLYLCNSRKNFVFRDIPLDQTYAYERDETIVDIGAYCLMSNHFHLLLKEKTEGGISTFMQKLLTGYSAYFNKKYDRTGVLFEGRFKATHATEDAYLKYLFSYIHLNPIKIIDPNWKENGIKDRVQAKEYLSLYQYSSYLDHMNKTRTEGKILNRVEFPAYFAHFREFEQFIDEWLVFRT